jgi:hypothetical protein
MMLDTPHELLHYGHCSLSHDSPLEPLEKEEDTLPHHRGDSGPWEVDAAGNWVSMVVVDIAALYSHQVVVAVEEVETDRSMQLLPYQTDLAMEAVVLVEEPEEEIRKSFDQVAAAVQPSTEGQRSPFEKAEVEGTVPEGTAGVAVDVDHSSLMHFLLLIPWPMVDGTAVGVEGEGWAEAVVGVWQIDRPWCVIRWLLPMLRTMKADAPLEQTVAMIGNKHCDFQNEEDSVVVAMLVAVTVQYSSPPQLRSRGRSYKASSS